MRRSYKKMLIGTGFLLASLPAWLAMAPTATAQGYSIQSERAAHPNMSRAIDAMYAALHDMEIAPANFGGNKAVAMEDLRRAIHSAKRALYFRLQMDDQRLDSIR